MKKRGMLLIFVVLCLILLSICTYAAVGDTYNCCEINIRGRGVISTDFFIVTDEQGTSCTTEITKNRIPDFSIPQRPIVEYERCGFVERGVHTSDRPASLIPCTGIPPTCPYNISRYTTKTDTGGLCRCGEKIYCNGDGGYCISGSIFYMNTDHPNFDAVPEFSLPTLLITLLTCITIIFFVVKK